MRKNDVDLKVDWATHAAAKYACEHWHYSKCLPSSMQKRVAVGAWEDGVYIGSVVFGHGANRSIGKPYGLTIHECVELTRVALRNSHVTPVSRIIRLALKFLKESQPGIRLVVSYADPEQGHHGGVYQAGNWLYTGTSAKSIKIWYKGKWSHKKTVDGSRVDQRGMAKKYVEGKHRYLMPLDKEMRKQIEPLRKPYPKKVDTRAGSEAVSHQSFQTGDGGSSPTSALNSDKEV